jgi:class 3 adenylate cyclase
LATVWRILGALRWQPDRAAPYHRVGGRGGCAGRSTATVLFTDLVGSTELRSRLGEAAAQALRRTHARLLTEAVQGHGGRVVKGLGDGIMAAFAGASGAWRPPSPSSRPSTG